MSARRKVLLGVIALAAGLLTIDLTSSDPVATRLFARIPNLTEEALGEARARWRATGPASYRMTLEMRGSELAAGRYEIAVEGGRATSVVRDGTAATGDKASYTVDGLLALLGDELALAHTPTRAFGAPEGYRAYLFCRFDAVSGIPSFYRRVVGGSNRYVEWTVTQFTPAAAD